jgi:multidrug efflux pump subunit AcrA (membrane-fusion protein)
MIHLLKRRGGKIAIVIILIIVLGMFWLHTSKKNANSMAAAPTIVKLMTVTNKNVSNLFTSIGTVKALQGTNISSTVAGKIATIQFISGQTIQQGQVLFTLENEDLASTVRQDRAKYTYDQVQYQRYAKLGPLGIVPQPV